MVFWGVQRGNKVWQGDHNWAMPSHELGTPDAGTSPYPGGF